MSMTKPLRFNTRVLLRTKHFPLADLCIVQVSSMQYIALIHNNTDSKPESIEWERFIAGAIETGMFKGGSAIGFRQTVGTKPVPATTRSAGGCMRFDSDDLAELRKQLDSHPVVMRGGTIELLEMPRTSE